MFFCSAAHLLQTCRTCRTFMSNFRNGCPGGAPRLVPRLATFAVLTGSIDGIFGSVKNIFTLHCDVGHWHSSRTNVDKQSWMTFRGELNYANKSFKMLLPPKNTRSNRAWQL